jgi:hypothetical protein
MSDAETRFHSWDTLPNDILRVIAPWQKFLDGLTEEEQDFLGVSLPNLIMHLVWLIPLAERLQQCPELRGLYPFVHHAVLQLSLQPTSVSYHPCFMILAESQERYRLSFYAEHGKSTPQDRLGEGSVEEITELLVEAVRRLCS